MYEIHGVRFVTLAEAAAMLGSDVKPSTIEKWVQRGKLAPVCKLDGKNIFRWKDVMEAEYSVRSSGTGHPRLTPRALRLTETDAIDTMSTNPQSDHHTQNEGRRFGSPVPPLDRSVVYYIRFSDRVKIGYSRNLAQRLGCIPHDEILAVEPGGREVELARHRQFTSCRIKWNGEWFRLTPAIRRHTVDLVRIHGTPGDFLRKSPPVPPSHRRVRGDT